MASYTRRKFLKRALQMTAFAVASKMFPFQSLNALAQTSEDYKALVCVFLLGGNDADNTVLPISGQARSDYDSVRSSLSISASSLLPIGTVNHSTYGSTDYGLHPSMSGIQGLSDNLAIVANMGNLVEPMTKEEYRNRTKERPLSLFSHSNQQDQMQTASPGESSSTGWGGRIIDNMPGVNNPSTFPTGVSLSGSNKFLAGSPSQAATISGSGGFQLSGLGGSFGEARTTAVQEMLDFDTGFSLVQHASSIFSDGLAIGEVINDALRNTTINTPFPSGSLGTRLRQVAQLIKSRSALGMKRQIFFVSTGGYDTHSNQPGRHSSLLTGLSEAMTAFYTATEELGIPQKVTSFTLTDFGRTFQPNQRGGSDHAWGGTQFILGGAVNSGIYGNFPTLQLDGPDTTDSRGRWIPTTSLDQCGATLATWYGLDPAELDTVFPNLSNFSSNNLGFV